MWPVVYTFMRSNARYIVFPVAIVIGALGYTIENMVSSKYTPYAPSIEQQRIERLTSSEALDHVMEKKHQRYESIFEKESNLSESLLRRK